MIAGLDDRIVGYVGWVRTTREIAEAWLKDDVQLQPAFEKIDAVVVTVLATDDSHYILPLIKHFKMLNTDHSWYWKRHFINGRRAAQRTVRKKSAAA